MLLDLYILTTHLRPRATGSVSEYMMSLSLSEAGSLPNSQPATPNARSLASRDMVSCCT